MSFSFLRKKLPFSSEQKFDFLTSNSKSNNHHKKETQQQYSLTHDYMCKFVT